MERARFCSMERRRPPGAPASAGFGICGLQPAPPASRPALWITLILCLAASVVTAENPYLQKALDSKFGTGEDSILMIDVKTGKLMAGVHPETMLRETHPPGSLIKILTTIAYAAEHGDRFPQYQCPPTLSRDPAGCWDRNGHGTVNLEKAIAYSCNVYFRRLADNITPGVFAETLHRFGLVRSPREILDLPESTQRKLMVGNTLDWSVTPILLLRAYSALYNGGRLWPAAFYDGPHNVALPPEAVFQRIRNGMRAGGEIGTSALAHRIAGAPLLGKTGTSLQLNEGARNWSRTQGWWIGLYPADAPEIAVMTFVRSGRGAVDAAPLGGRALAEYLKISHAR